MIKRLVLAVLFVGVVVGGIVGFNMFRDRMIAQFFAGMQPPPVTVSVIEAEPRAWRPGIETIGTARAAQGVELAVEVPGIVTEVIFSANDRVEAGTHLVQLDDVVERADLLAAETSLELAMTELGRIETLRERGVIASTNVDTAQAAATNARAQVARVTAILQQKELKAPFSGVVGIPRVDVGEYVVPGTVYASLQDLDVMRVDFTIPEQQLRVISIGLPVTISMESGGPEFSGTISGIDPRIDANTRLVTMRAEVENPEGAINPGQFLRVRVELPEEDGVIVLPQTAISSNLYGDSVFVVRQSTAEDGTERMTVEQVFVQVGRRTQGLVEVTEGVNPGELIVSAGQNRLSGGAAVVIAETAAAPQTAAVIP